MKSLIALLLCLFIPCTTTALAAENSYKVVYDGGSLPNLKSGTNAKFLITPTTIQLRNGKDGKDEVITIPATAITEISYGQDVHRRIGTAIGLAVISLGIGALMAFSKSKKHFVGLTWVDGEKKGGFAMQCDKNDYRGVLAALEGITGKKAVDSDAMNVKN
jgi:hypothetical protein